MSIHRYATPYYKAYLIKYGELPAYLARNPRADYIERIVWASLPGITPRDFRPLLIERAWKNRSTGVKHVLDHIIPITHPYVCGLNVPWNVEVMPAKCNAAKSNKWNPNQLSLLPDPIPEQLQLLRIAS